MARRGEGAGEEVREAVGLLDMEVEGADGRGDVMVNIELLDIVR